MSLNTEITRIENAKTTLKTKLNSRNDNQHQITNELIDEYGDFVDSIPQGGGSSGVTFDNVSYGLTQPSASSYKYWIPVDTTKESKPVKMVPKCQIKDTFQELSATDLSLGEIVYGSISYSSSQMLRTKDYIASVPEERSSSASFTINFYQRSNKNNNMFNILENTLTGEYITVNKATCFPDIATSNVAINYAVDSARTDNYIYFVYNTSSSTHKIVRYDLSTKTLYNVGTYYTGQSGKFPGSSKGVSLYVKDDQTFYVSQVFLNDSTYTLGIFRCTLTPNPGYAPTFAYTTIGEIPNYGNGNYMFNKLDNQYLAIGSVYSTTSMYILDINNNTVFLSSTGLKTEIQSSLTNLVSGASLYSTNYMFYNSPNNGKIMAWLFNNSNYYGIYFFYISSNGTTFSVIPELVLNVSQDDTILLNSLQKVAKYDLNLKEIYYYFNSINLINDNNIKTIYLPNGTFSVSATIKENSSIVCENISCIHQNLTNIDSTNNVIIPILSCEDYMNQSFYKFYLDENDNYSVVPVDTMDFSNYKLPAFYNNTRYDIYVSDGTNWNNVVNTSDSDYINIH